MSLAHAVIAAAAALSITHAASGYEEVVVRDGGTLKGTISVKDKELRDEVLIIEGAAAHHCGKSLSAEKYVVSSEGSLRNAVVMIERITRGKPLESSGELSITNDKCRFVPHVMVATKGAKIRIQNNDPLLHTVHYYHLEDESSRHVANLAQPRQGLVTEKTNIFRKSGLHRVICNVHVFMQAWAWVIEHPYATVTPADGSFVLENVPPGSYRLRIWHEALGERSVDVVVEAGKTEWINIAL